MATSIIMPRQGQSVESCIIGKWHKAVGDPVAVGDLLFTYETDKAVFDEASTVEGTFLARFFEEGDDVPVLTVVCVVGQPGEAIDGQETPQPVVETEADPAEAMPAAADKAATPAGKPASVPAAAAVLSADAVGISPRARNLAIRLGVEAAGASSAGALAGTGPAGRVIERDVRTAADSGLLATPSAAAMLKDPRMAAQPGTGLGGRIRAADVVPAAERPASAPEKALADEVVDRPHTKIRKAIGTAMQMSLATMAQLTLNSSFDATDLISLRSRLKTVRENGQAEAYGLSFAGKVPTVTDFILYAVSRVLKRHPLLNAHGFDDHIRLFGAVHLGIAVDTPRGLMVPTVFHADSLTIGAISDATGKLAEACRGGAIDPDLLRGGTFTVTNLGALGIESFTPVINPPQTAILGVCAPSTRLRETSDAGTPSTYVAIPLSLTFDHKALDGADAARFLQDLTRYLSNISVYMIG